MKQWWHGTDREAEVVRTEACLNATLSSTGPTRTGSGIEMWSPWPYPTPFHGVHEYSLYL